ncbi:MAG TPA: VRR-NUC domain-containing protein [Candidatus Binatia bacterium]|nr:VRR-NUC domain-containing protein [Candidatus Binatia bacterium]
MRQTTLLEFGLKITTVYVPIRNYPYKTRHGLAELQLRRRLEKQGWQVWRGDFIHLLWTDAYPSVRRKYDPLSNLLLERFGAEMLDTLGYFSYVHHGIPDFLCYNPITQEFKFVECKLGHEQLSARQVLTIQKLSNVGFTTEVHKLVEACTKTRKAEVNIALNEKRVVEREMTLNVWKERSRR